MLAYLSASIPCKGVSPLPFPGSFRYDFATWMSGMYICALLTPLVIWLGHRFPIQRHNWARQVGLHVLFSIAFSFVQLAVHSAIIEWFGLIPSLPKSYSATFLALIGAAFQLNLATNWFILGISRVFRLYRQYQEQQKHALTLERNAAELKAQLADS